MDVNTNAFRIVQALTEKKDPKATARSATARSAGGIGGRNRAKWLSPERRREIASMGGAARRKKSNER